MEPVPIAEPIPPAPIPPAAVIPVIHAQLNDLAATEPGPAAQSKVGAILSLIVSVLQNPAVAAQIPVGWKAWTAATVAALALLAATFGAGVGTGRVTAPVQPPAAQKNEPVPEAWGNKHSTDPEPAPKAPKVIPPAAPKIVAPAKLLTVYVTDAATGPAVMADLGLKALLERHRITLAVDPKLYEDKSTVGGVLLPCVVLTVNGTVLDVAPLGGPADLAAFITKHGDKK